MALPVPQDGLESRALYEEAFDFPCTANHHPSRQEASSSGSQSQTLRCLETGMPARSSAGGLQPCHVREARISAHQFWRRCARWWLRAWDNIAPDCGGIAFDRRRFDHSGNSANPHPREA